MAKNDFVQTKERLSHQAELVFQMSGEEYKMFLRFFWTQHKVRTYPLGTIGPNGALVSTVEETYSIVAADIAKTRRKDSARGRTGKYWYRDPADFDLLEFRSRARDFIVRMKDQVDMIRVRQVMEG